ncbi:DEAD-box type RNA helicase [Apiotrichum porosum]|uniref:DEAD-box type RNA helicase n=1 Tax=Apiotrichum porosum TaxID=105984 RepID=A0A427XGA5_9TREE|nr:DEAD-box type RNA helicase [Apiotrichum porosum]RSH77797.1 DEAD-box type RNA helicase [Apiotrichum porosum]
MSSNSKQSSTDPQATGRQFNTPPVVNPSLARSFTSSNVTGTPTPQHSSTAQAQSEPAVRTPLRDSRPPLTPPTPTPTHFTCFGRPQDPSTSRSRPLPQPPRVVDTGREHHQYNAANPPPIYHFSTPRFGEHFGTQHLSPAGIPAFLNNSTYLTGTSMAPLLVLSSVDVLPPFSPHQSDVTHVSADGIVYDSYGRPFHVQRSTQYTVTPYAPHDHAQHDLHPPAVASWPHPPPGPVHAGPTEPQAPFVSQPVSATAPDPPSPNVPTHQHRLSVHTPTPSVQYEHVAVANTPSRPVTPPTPSHVTAPPSRDPIDTHYESEELAVHKADSTCVPAVTPNVSATDASSSTPPAAAEDSDGGWRVDHPRDSATTVKPKPPFTAKQLKTANLGGTTQPTTAAPAAAPPNETQKERCQTKTVCKYYELPQKPHSAPGQAVVFHPRVVAFEMGARATELASGQPVPIGCIYVVPSDLALDLPADDVASALYARQTGLSVVTGYGLNEFFATGVVPDESSHPLCKPIAFEPTDFPPVRVVSDNMGEILNRTAAAMRSETADFAFTRPRRLGKVSLRNDRARYVVLHPDDYWNDLPVDARDELWEGDDFAPHTLYTFSSTAISDMQQSLAQDKPVQFVRHHWFIQCLDKGRFSEPLPHDIIPRQEVFELVGSVKQSDPLSFLTRWSVRDLTFRWILDTSSAEPTYPRLQEEMSLLTNVPAGPIHSVEEFIKTFVPLFFAEFFHSLRAAADAAIDPFKQPPDRAPPFVTATLQKVEGDCDGVCCVFLKINWLVPDVDRPKDDDWTTINREAGSVLLLHRPSGKFVPVIVIRWSDNALRVHCLVDDVPELQEAPEFYLIQLTAINVVATAIMGIEHYDQRLVQEALTGRRVSEDQQPPVDPVLVKQIADNWQLNQSQAAAVATAVSTLDRVMLIKGPPGTGKTHTAAAIVSLVLSHTPHRRVLVLAPSNSSVDQAAARLRELKLLDGSSFAPSLVRVGRQQAISQYMSSHSLDTLVEIRFGETVDRQRRKVLTESDIICTTLAGADILRQYRLAFDYIFVEEAAQCTEVDMLTAYALADARTRLILIGDLSQLSALVHGPARHFNFEQSLFERLSRCYTKTVYLLNEQYRMCRRIAEFLSSTFYDNSLLSHPSVDKMGKLWGGDSGIMWYDVTGMDYRTASQSRTRFVEVPVVLSVLNQLQQAFQRNGSSHTPPSVGVIASYAAQRHKLQEAFDSAIEADPARWCPDTVDGFQGREKDIVSVSVGRSSGKTIGFLDNTRRLVVALSRARHLVILVGDADYMVKFSKPASDGTNPWVSLIDHTRRTGMFRKA